MNEQERQTEILEDILSCVKLVAQSHTQSGGLSGGERNMANHNLYRAIWERKCKREDELDNDTVEADAVVSEAVALLREVDGGSRVFGTPGRERVTLTGPVSFRPRRDALLAKLETNTEKEPTK